MKLYFGSKIFFRSTSCFITREQNARAFSTGRRFGRDRRKSMEERSTISTKGKGRGVDKAAVADGVQGRRMARLRNGRDELRHRVTRERNICGWMVLATPDKLGCAAVW